MKTTMAIGTGLLLTCIFARLILLQNAAAVLYRGPQNTEAVVGSSVEIFCITSEEFSINWEHTPVGDNSPKDVSHSSMVIPPYDEWLELKVNRLTGEYRLIIPSVQKVDAGRYECIDEAGQGERRTAELVVLESNPRCQENIDPNGILIENDCGLHPESIEFKCSLRYAGNNEPQLRWTETGRDQIINPNNTNTERLPGQSIVTVSIKPTLEADGRSYTCQTSWSNISWTSPPIKLLYAFNGFLIQRVYQPILMDCAANSSQPCRYEWIHNGMPLTAERTLDINNHGQYTCLARCQIRKHLCVVNVKMVEYIPADVNQEIGIIIAVTIAATVFVTISIAVVVFKFVKPLYFGDTNGRLNSSSRILITKSPPVHIQGIATDGNKLYIIRRGEKCVLTYGLEESSKLIREIKNENFEDLRDIAAKKRYFLLTDAGQSCVWKMNLLFGTKFRNPSKFIQNVHSPYTISINSRGEILMAQDPNELRIYNTDGSLKHSSSILGVVAVFHAIQASSDTIAMSVILTYGNNQTHGIILVSETSTHFEKEYIGEDFGALYQPFHIAANEQGSIYVADHGKERILILDKDLKPVQSVSFSIPYVRPTRLQYVRRQLIVGQNNGVVQVFGSTYLEGLKRVSQLSIPSEESSINDSEDRDQLLSSH